MGFGHLNSVHSPSIDRARPECEVGETGIGSLIAGLLADGKAQPHELQLPVKPVEVPIFEDVSAETPGALGAEAVQAGVVIESTEQPLNLNPTPSSQLTELG